MHKVFAAVAVLGIAATTQAASINVIDTGALDANLKSPSGAFEMAFSTPTPVGTGAEGLYSVDIILNSLDVANFGFLNAFGGPSGSGLPGTITGKLHNDQATGFVNDASPNLDASGATAIDTHFLFGAADLSAGSVSQPFGTTSSTEPTAVPGGAAFYDPEFTDSLNATDIAFTNAFADSGSIAFAQIVTQLNEEITFAFDTGSSKAASDFQTFANPVVFQITAPPVNLIGDADGDGDVDAFDLTAVNNNFGNSGAPGSVTGDADNDGDVDAFDLTAVNNNFGASAGLSAGGGGEAGTVPEPATLALLGLGGLLMLRRSR